MVSTHELSSTLKASARLVIQLHRLKRGHISTQTSDCHHLPALLGPEQCNRGTDAATQWI